MSAPSADLPISKPIITRGHLTHPAVVVPLVLGVVFAVAADLFDSDAGFVAAALALIAAGGAAVACLEARQSVAITAGGFVLVSSPGRRWVFRDEDVRGLLLRELPGYCDVRLEVEKEGAPAVLRLEYRHSVRDGDPLAALWHRLIDSLAGRARERLDASQVLAGDGWEVRHGCLHGLGPSEGLALRDVQHAREIEGEVRLWLGNEARPRVCLPARGPNAQVLLRLVRLLCQEGEGAALGEGAAREGLGPLLYERAAIRRGFAVGLAWLLPIPFMVWAVVANRASARFVEGLVCSALFIFLVLLAQGSGLRLLLRPRHPGRLALHRWGLALTTEGRSLGLRYDEIETVTWGWPIIFAPSPRSPSPPIRFDGDPGDPELQRVRDRLARQRARAWLAELDAGRSVFWTEGVRFLPEGLECRLRTFFRRDRSCLVPYAEVGFLLARGVLHVHQRWATRAVVEADAPNFHAGLELLERMMDRQRAGDGEPRPLR